MDLENIIEGESSTPKLKEREVEHIKMPDLNEIIFTYSLGDVLGTGTFGVVQEISNKITKQVSALKTVPKFNRKGPMTDAEQIQKELTILKMVDHPHIVRLEISYECPKAYYLVFEKCGSDLSKLLRERVRFTEDWTRIVIKRLSDALAYLHDHDIAHRDLKLENILVASNPSDPDDDLYIKVIDFGLGAIRKGQGYENMVEECCGTPAYMAPEILARKSYSQQCDVWSMGVIMYYLLSGRMPFEKTKHCTVMETIQTSEPKYRASAWGNYHQAVNVCKRMLTKDPAFRYTAAEVRDDDWTNNKIVAREDQKYRGNILEMMATCANDFRMPLGKQSDWVTGETCDGLSGVGDKPSVPSSPRQEINKKRVEALNDQVAKLTLYQDSSSPEDECFESSEGDADSNDSDDPKLNWFRILEEHKRGQQVTEFPDKSPTKTKPVGKKSRIPIPSSKKPKVLGDKLHVPITSPKLGKKSRIPVPSPKGAVDKLLTTVTSPTFLRKKPVPLEQPNSLATLVPKRRVDRPDPEVPTRTVTLDSARLDASRNRTLIAPSDQIYVGLPSRVSATVRSNNGQERRPSFPQKDETKEWKKKH